LLLLFFLQFASIAAAVHLSTQNPLSEISTKQRIDQLDDASAETKLSFTEDAKIILPTVVSISCT